MSGLQTGNRLGFVGDDETPVRALAHSVIARGAAEEEIDCRQTGAVLQVLHDFMASRRTKRAFRPAV